MRELKVRILSNTTVNMAAGLLKDASSALGLQVDVEVGSYDNIVQDCLKKDSVDVIAIFWDVVNFAADLFWRFDALSESEMDELAEKILGELDIVLQSTSDIPLVIFNLFTFQENLVAPRQAVLFDGMCSRLNISLRDHAGANVFIISPRDISSRLGGSRAVDWKYYHAFKQLWTKTFLNEWSLLAAAAMLHVAGKMKKVVVVDCDNTLWSGVVGEEGPGGVKMSIGQIGAEPHVRLQHSLSKLGKTGVVLALSSKNEEHDVRSVFDANPGSVLSFDDFVVKRINWDDKVENLHEIAKFLNLGLDSFVFIDDSPFEIENVKARLPMVECLRFETGEVAEDRILARLDALFTRGRITDEDLQRTGQYRDEARRTQLKAEHETLQGFIRSLNIRVRILSVTPDMVTRISQLCMKTNQFNLSTKRYSEADIQAMVENDAYMLRAVFVSDDYGDSGLVGAYILKQDPENTILDSFLLSCRVLGRTVEHAVLDSICKQLMQQGISQMLIEFRSTDRNAPLIDFLESLGINVSNGSQNPSHYFFGSNSPRIHYFVEVVDEA